MPRRRYAGASRLSLSNTGKAYRAGRDQRDSQMTSYTWQEIQSDWLAGGTLTLSPEEVEASFNRVVEKFGREWIEASRTTNGAVSRGVQPSLKIATLGLLLQVLDRASDPSSLLEKIRDRQEDAWAELCAIYLVCSDKADFAIELEPEITVDRRDPKPDFRVRSGDEPWTYAEVTVASRDSDAQRPILRSMERLANLVTECTGNYALEVYLKREPRVDELALIESQIREHHLSAATAKIELPSGLGTLYWNQHPPGFVFLDNHGEPYRPGLAVVKAPIIDGERPAYHSPLAFYGYAGGGNVEKEGQTAACRWAGNCNDPGIRSSGGYEGMARNNPTSI